MSKIEIPLVYTEFFNGFQSEIVIALLYSLIKFSFYQDIIRKPSSTKNIKARERRKHCLIGFLETTTIRKQQCQIKQNKTTKNRVETF
ncbi:hypothetical protein [Helicobacter sp. 11-8110]|uniref:hypothetical protein n=1 Tax=Helicobacter sp. 11-8110 TaxID=2004997 RepID=UPI000DCF1F30|nr:hypothetical protein [Helicobacter sp. 11-8110]RAX51739.1 hypothetical protein CCY98_06895 [Helicobacter sp. 11-8110]